LPGDCYWEIGNLDAGGEAVLSVPAVITDPEPPACIVNVARSSFAGGEEDTNDEARAALHQPGMERCADVDVSLAISAMSSVIFFPSCDLWENYDGQVTVTNHGPDAAKMVAVSIAQSPSTGPIVRFSDSDCSNASSQECLVAEIAAGESLFLDVTSDSYQSYSAFTQTLVVSASTGDVDYDLSNNAPSSTGRDWLRALVRGLLAPVVYAIERPGHALLLLIGLLALLLRRRKRPMGSDQVMPLFF